MGIVSDVTSVIGLVKKAKELADQMANLELKEVIVDLQSKVLDLKEEINTLREENARLTEQVKLAPIAGLPPKEKPEIMYGCYYFNGDASNLYCPRCYEREGRKHVMAHRPRTGYKCTVCENFIRR